MRVVESVADDEGDSGRRRVITFGRNTNRLPAEIKMIEFRLYAAAPCAHAAAKVLTSTRLPEGAS